MSRFTRFFRVNFQNPGTVLGEKKLTNMMSDYHLWFFIILIMLVVSNAVRRSRRRIAASKGMGGLVWERPRIFVRSWWGWGPQDDSTKSWWLGSRSGLFIINMIIKIIMIIFVIIIIWFRAHGRGDSVLCFVRRWQDPAGREWRAALQPNIRIPRQRHFHHHVHRLIMMIIINHHHRPWWSL